MLSASRTYADEEVPPDVPSTPRAAKHEKRKKPTDGDQTTKKTESHPRGALEFGARVFARSAVSKDVADTEARGHTSLESARASADYHFKKQIHMQVEVELAGKARIKDAYVQLRIVDGPPRVQVRAGNFKMPFSGIETTSIWNLPTADRGLLHAILVDRLQVAGRAVGGVAMFAVPAALHAELRFGAFQAVDDAGNPLAADAGDRFGQDYVARASIEPTKGVEIGASYSMRLGQLLVLPPVVRRAWASDLDASLEVPVGPGRARLWVEGMVGTSWLVADTMRAKATFTEGRGIAAYRFGGAGEGDRYLEPYALVGALDPDAEIRRDLAFETAVGLTYGAWDRWRVQAELERWKVGANAPVGIVELGIAPTTSTTVLVQIGARL